MTNDSVRLDDEALLGLYARCQAERGGLCASYSQVSYDDFINRRRYDGTALLVILVTQDHMFAITNSMGRFLHHLSTLAGWSKLFASFSEAEKIQALFEFIDPLISALLSNPYSIKGQFVTSIYQISSHTSRLCSGSKEALRPRPTFKDAEKAAKGFSTWPTLSAALSDLNSQNFQDASDNYRNRQHHGFPRGIELGERLIIEPTKADQTVHAIRAEPPLQLSTLLPLIEDQYRAAVLVYNEYTGLIKEQERSWRSP
jgi:hypothetical protein